MSVRALFRHLLECSMVWSKWKLVEKVLLCRHRNGITAGHTATHNGRRRGKCPSLKPGAKLVTSPFLQPIGRRLVESSRASHQASKTDIAALDVCRCVRSGTFSAMAWSMSFLETGRLNRALCCTLFKCQSRSAKSHSSGGNVAGSIVTVDRHYTG